ncbi:MAG TPA: AraC family transcriptional regulator [Bacteroidales bacterium]|nr:AraC family transcriptional regulator [Bacteroidales bacterium]
MRESKHIERLLQRYKQRLPESIPLSPDNVRRALAVIIAHLFDPGLNVRWMKERCYITDHNFSGRFKYYVGLSPRQYITKHRIAAARLLLQAPVLHQCSITVVALRVGFNRHSTFTKAFKRIEGIPPSAYRRKFKK